MKILLIYPEKTDSKKGVYTLLNRLITTKKSEPIELIEISIQLPITWERKLVNMNLNKLESSDIAWADYVIIKADDSQAKSTLQLVKKCKQAGKKIIGEGALFRAHNNFENIDHLILSDTEVKHFIADLEAENTKKFYPFRLLKKEDAAENSYFSLQGFSRKFQRNLQLFHT